MVFHYCSGYVRQRGLNVNGLLHIVGAGDFQMDRIDGLINLQTSQPSNGGYTDGEADGKMPTCWHAIVPSGLRKPLLGTCRS